MKNQPLLKVMNILSVVAALAVNGLANVLPLNNQQTGDIAESFGVYFLPAGYVFAIWGIIYIGLILFAIFQALPSQDNNPRLARIGWLFVLSNLANLIWLVFWHYNQFVLSELAMLALLGCLIAIYLRFEIGVYRPSGIESWMAHVPFQIYLGWISVATIANTTVTLKHLDFAGGGLGEPVWAVIMMVVGLVLGLLMAYRRGDAIFNLVLAWSFAGIGVRFAAEPLLGTASYVLAVLALAVALWALWRSRKA